ncbi:autolysin sensor kinase [Lachnospiraceae bacterium KM106-2]|nr:autolysin sensor kinase [Lachnospiraceae bacterium KM106-2]
MKMRMKILVLCLSSTLLALILQTVLFKYKSSSLIYNQTRNENLHLLDNMQNEIYTYIKAIEKNLIQVYTDKDFLHDMASNQNESELSKKYDRMAYQIVTEEFQTGDRVDALYVYNIEHRLISTYRRAVTPKYNYPKDIYNKDYPCNAEMVKKYVSSEQNNMLISSYYNKYRKKNIIRFVIRFYDTRNIQRKIGYIVCDVDSIVLNKIIDKYKSQQGMYIWLQPRGDRVTVFDGSVDEENQEYYQNKVMTIKKGKTSSEKEESIGNHVLFCVGQNKYNLDAYSLMQNDMLKENQRGLTQSLLIIALIMIIAITLIFIVASSGITKHLVQLMKTIEMIKSGDTQKRVTYLKDDEIGRLGREFNEMLDEIRDLISEEYETKLMLKNAEYKALQAQINPHFLYNTLDTMSSIASVQDCEIVSSLCQSLSNLFRYSLDMKHPYTTLAKEIIYLKNYIFVMNVRMGGEVQYKFDIDETALNEKVPRISIQPLVENALQHGIKNKTGDKVIELIARIRGEQLQIIVKDNGLGMDATKLNQQLEENKLELVEEGNSIGLLNINARMKMIYGEDCGLQIKSEIGKGTSVILTIHRAKVDEVKDV